MRVVQLANFVSPTSGGIRTALAHLRAGYREAGHDTVLVVPGPRVGRELGDDGLVIRIGAPVIPGTGGYRAIVDVPAVARVLDELRPDRVEVSDRFTLRAVGSWAKRRGVPSMLVVHERLDRLAANTLPWPLRPRALVARDNNAVAARFDTVVTPSNWAAGEFRDAGVDGVNVVPWGVDLERFTPLRRSAVLRRRLAGDAAVLAVMVCRLSPEKRPETAIAALVGLRARGVDARLVVAGTGSRDRHVQRLAKDQPVTFLGHLHGRDHVAELLAAADVAICPGPVETFGLAALEALASGTPVVASRHGAIAEVVAAPYGEATYNHGPSLAAAAERLLDAGPQAREAARAAAEAYPWERAVSRMLTLHRLEPASAGLGGRPPG